MIGGGVTGVAIAREAAVRGFSVCCLEKNDFGCATSAATSKLLHGGLRYLANFEFGIVRESLRERRILGCAAPHLVRPLKFLVPIYAGEKPTRLEMKIALVLYDLLAFDRNRGVAEDKRLPGHSWLSRSQVLRLEPGVNSRGVSGGELKGAYVYYDYQSVFPERLLLDWALTGAQAGAHFLNHCEVIDLKDDGGAENSVATTGEKTKTITAARVRDTLTGAESDVRGRLFINASGPYMDYVLRLANFESPPIKRSTGVHLITDPLFAPEKDHTVFVKGRRNDQFLILPWQGRSLIGPTDEPFDGHPDEVTPRASEVDALVADLEAALPPGVFHRDMIRHVITGIRPLVSFETDASASQSGAQSGKRPQSATRAISRKSEIYDHAPALKGVLSVGGGKWTTSRALGVHVVDAAARKLRVNRPTVSVATRKPRANTTNAAFASAPGFGESAEEYAAFAVREYQTPGVPESVHRHLITMYGTRHAGVLELVRATPRLAERISMRPNCLDIFAQLDFAVRMESALTLDDLLRRRLSLGMFGRPERAEVEAVANHAAPLLDWDAERTRAEIELIARFYRE